MTLLTVAFILSPLATALVFPPAVAWFHRRRVNRPYISPSGLPDFLNMPVGQRWPVTTPDLGDRND